MLSQALSMLALLAPTVGMSATATRADESQFTSGICRKCNLVLMSIDSLRADHMSVYGYKVPTTPNLEKLAPKSLVFENYFSTSHLTPLSEGSVHTGLYPERHGIINFRTRFDPKIRTLARILKENGYATIADGNSPEFVFFKNLQDSFGQGFDHFRMNDRFRMDEKSRELSWSRIEAALDSAKKPFFLWLPVGTVHAPFGFKVKSRFGKDARSVFYHYGSLGNLDYYYDGLVYKPDKYNDFLFQHPELTADLNLDLMREEFRKSTAKWPLKVTASDIENLVGLYDNGVAAADEEVGRLFRLLQERRLDRNTVVVIVSEHGETLNEHKYVAHYDIWEEATHVPLIVSSPALKTPGRPKDLYSGVDVLPTLLTHLDIPSQGLELDGRSFLAGGEVLPGRDEVVLIRSPFWESLLKVRGSASIFDDFRKLDEKSGIKDYAIRGRRWKLFHRLGRFAERQYSCWKYVSGKDVPLHEEYELFDLEKDPTEQRPLAPGAYPAGAELRSKLEKFEAWISSASRKTRPVPQIEDYR